MTGVQGKPKAPRAQQENASTQTGCEGAELRSILDALDTVELPEWEHKSVLAIARRSGFLGCVIRRDEFMRLGRIKSTRDVWRGTVRAETNGLIVREWRGRLRWYALAPGFFEAVARLAAEGSHPRSAA